MTALERISDRLTLWLVCKRIDFRAKHPEVPWPPLDAQRVASLKQKFPNCKKIRGGAE
jgi:hypothetical protein